VRGEGGAGRLNYVNYDDVLLQLQAFGLQVDHLQVNTNRPVRCKETQGDREKRGWYWLTDIELRDEAGTASLYITGGFGIWRGAENFRGKVKLSRRLDVTREQLQAMAERHRAIVKRAKAERLAEAKRAAARAQKAWAAYLPDGESPYLVAKQVAAYGVRFSPSGNGTLAVPMQDTSGRIWGLQIIRAEARSQLAKEYWPKGLEKVGHFHLLGAPRAGGVTLIAEGYATAATAYSQGGGVPVAVAFDAGNLIHVAKALVAAYPGIRLGFLADDDYRQKCRQRDCGKYTHVEEPTCEHCGAEHGQKNPGVEAAKAAAHAVNGFVLIPQWPFDRANAKITDYNDLACHPQGGAHHVRAQLLAGLTEAGAVDKLAGLTAPSAQHGGEGDSRKAAVSVMALDALVERFIPIDDGTGETVFDTWSQKLVLKKQMVALLAAGLKLDDVKRHPMWINRGSYYLDQVGFDPAGTDTRLKINTWKGWPSKPQRGECELALDLLRHLCQGEENSEEIFDWVIRWLAYPLQHPGAKMQTALVVHGPQGTGKSIIFEAIARIYGDYSMVLNQGAIEDKFNSDWAARKLFIVADEIVARQEMHHIKNLLKGFITQEWIRVNPKNLPAYRERNHMNMVFLSNERQPLVLENDDRRHCVIWTSPPLDQDYYSRLGAELANGGLAALHQYLLDVDLGDFKPWTKPPMTKSKGDLIDYGRNSVDRFVRDWQNLDIEGRDGKPLPFCPCLGSDLYAAYRKWCHANGERELAAKHLTGHCKKIRGWSAGENQNTWDNFRDRQNKIRRMVVPSATDMAESLKRCATGTQAALQPDRAVTKRDWLTQSFFAFHDALDGGAQ
jgi:putative DNA primase/helicase